MWFNYFFSFLYFVSCIIFLYFFYFSCFSRNIVVVCFIFVSHLTYFDFSHKFLSVFKFFFPFFSSFPSRLLSFSSILSPFLSSLLSLVCLLFFLLVFFPFLYQLSSPSLASHITFSPIPSPPFHFFGALILPLPSSLFTLPSLVSCILSFSFYP